MKTLLRNAIRSGIFLSRRYTSTLRMLPDFLIIGTQKGGTTSLYAYLSQHPNIAPPFGKELHYFDLNYQRGLGWYRSSFPLQVYKHYYEQTQKQPLLTGEASPYYLFHPFAPQRVAALIPQVKLIVLLRNPVDRAFSHYYHEVKNGRESLSFEEAIDQEKERLPLELTHFEQDEHYYSYFHHRFAYLARGIYIDQLQKWQQYFSVNQLLVLKSEAFFSNPKETYRKVIDFLNLPHWYPDNFQRYNAGRYADKLDPEIKQQLHNFYAPHNERLYEYLGRRLDW